MNVQLYRHYGDKTFGPYDPETGAMLMWVIPVEPCEHGKIDGHLIPPATVRDADGYDWCPGAGLGDDQ